MRASMSMDFLIGAIRASRDLHPVVQTELEEILHRVEEDENGMDSGDDRNGQKAKIIRLPESYFRRV